MPILLNNNRIIKHQSPLQITVPNAGGVGTTDWVDSNLDGLANNWTQHTLSIGNTITTIVNGNGFTGNAQRLECTQNTSYMFIYTTSAILDVKNTTTYKFSVKYRTNSSKLKLTFFIAPWSSSLSMNTGNASYVEQIVTHTYTYNQSNAIVGIWIRDAVVGEWFEIDEYNVIRLDNYKIIKT